MIIAFPWHYFSFFFFFSFFKKKKGNNLNPASGQFCIIHLSLVN